MTQEERRVYLINYLLSEREEYKNLKVPEDEEKQKICLRALLNVRPPQDADEGFLSIQDTYLKEEINCKGVTDIEDLTPIEDNLYIWQGDITTLKCDAIVNAANSQMLGCFYPNHGCIDNAIHTYAGIELRKECNEIMCRQKHPEGEGNAKITSSYNLPCKYILHTVGPFVRGKVSVRDKLSLASCYESCLKLAADNEIESIAFCCISTGEFHFPNDMAAEIAVKTVKEYISNTNSRIRVIFNVYKDADLEIYKRIL